VRLFETAMGVGVERVCNGADGIGVSVCGRGCDFISGKDCRSKVLRASWRGRRGCQSILVKKSTEKE